MSTWKNALKTETTEWLLQSTPWTKYRTMTDLLDRPETDEDVKMSREAILRHPLVMDEIKSLQGWFENSVTRHNTPDLPPHRLKFLADLGVRAEDPGMENIITQIEANRQDGMFAVRQTLPEKKLKIPDKNAREWHALPCDAPEISTALIQMGYSSPALKESVETVRALWEKEEPWFCHFFFVEGQYRKHQAHCPMAGLMALDLISRTNLKEDSGLIEKAFSALEYHRSLGQSLYYFGRAKKFWTFKFPFVWYNALYMTDVITRFPILHDRPLTEEAINWIIESQNTDGRWKATSVFRPFKEWDFGQKREDSPWITFLCARILKQRFA